MKRLTRWTITLATGDRLEYVIANGCGATVGGGDWDINRLTDGTVVERSGPALHSAGSEVKEAWFYPWANVLEVHAVELSPADYKSVELGPQQ